MTLDRYRPLLDASPFAVLATHGPGRRLDLVPCCFAIDGEEIVSAVDHKPKRTARLARLENIERDPTVGFLVDHRDAEDWSKLWWVKAEGVAVVVDDGPEHVRAVDALVAKYAQYRERRPTGPAIRIRVVRWTGWTP